MNAKELQKELWKCFLIGFVIGCGLVSFIVTFYGCSWENPNTVWSDVPDITINKEK